MFAQFHLTTKFSSHLKNLVIFPCRRHHGVSLVFIVSTAPHLPKNLLKLVAKPLSNSSFRITPPEPTLRQIKIVCVFM
jgi:hypothetical protein